MNDFISQPLPSFALCFSSHLLILIAVPLPSLILTIVIYCQSGAYPNYRWVDSFKNTAKKSFALDVQDSPTLYAPRSCWNVANLTKIPMYFLSVNTLFVKVFCQHSPLYFSSRRFNFAAILIVALVVILLIEKSKPGRIFPGNGFLLSAAENCLGPGDQCSGPFQCCQDWGPYHQSLTCFWSPGYGLICQ
jgi:hypothetical protein